jgi:Mrp family chromosome partitioning ATPase
MSKNFELMQRAGKLLEIEIPATAEPAAGVAAPSIAPAFQPTLAPDFAPELTPTQSEKWISGHAARHQTADQIAREESRRMVQQIFMVQMHEPPRVVVIAGIDHGNGCSRICAYTAEALRENLRGSICLVEANFRSPSTSASHGRTGHLGLTAALRGEGPIRSFAQSVGRDKYVLPCGSLAADSHALLTSNRLRNRFIDLRNEFDFVVVDAPPLTRYSDAITQGKVADGVVLVLEANSTRREAAIRVSEHLRSSQIRILGAVLNKRTFPIPEPLYRHL